MTLAADPADNIHLETVPFNALDMNGETTQLQVSKNSSERLIGKFGITSLTPIQSETFSAIMQGRDVLARSYTGSGKTLAYSLPLIETLLKAAGRPLAPGRPQALVMLPTRDLAQQVHKDMMRLAGRSLSSIAAVGGTALDPQVDALRAGVDILVGTPGRIVDLLRSRSLFLSNLRFLVLDEADSMLEDGFAEEVDYVLESLNFRNFEGEDVQSLLFCATLQREVERIARRICRQDMLFMDLVKLEGFQQATEGSGPGSGTPNVRHLTTPVAAAARHLVVSDLIAVHKSSRTLVFVATKREAVDLSSSGGCGEVDNLHGDLPQFQRSRVMDAFREGTLRVLVATDVAARWIHVDGLDLVVHAHRLRRNTAAQRRGQGGDRRGSLRASDRANRPHGCRRNLRPALRS